MGKIQSDTRRCTQKELTRLIDQLEAVHTVLAVIMEIEKVKPKDVDLLDVEMQNVYFKILAIGNILTQKIEKITLDIKD